LNSINLEVDATLTTWIFSTKCDDRRIGRGETRHNISANRKKKRHDSEVMR
jgi:hypothetical protein